MRLIGGKNAKKKTSSSSTKRHFTVVIGSKEHGLYVSSSPSSAARKAVSKLCATDKKRKVEFSIREITQGSKKKTYGPYKGYIEKLKEPIELKGRVIRYKPVAKLSGKTGAKKGGMRGGAPMILKFVSDTDLDMLYRDKKFYEALDYLSKDRNNIFKIVEASSEDFPAFTGNGYLPDETSYNYKMALLNLKSLLFSYTGSNNSFFILKPKGLDLERIPKEDLEKYMYLAANYEGRFFEYR